MNDKINVNRRKLLKISGMSAATGLAGYTTSAKAADSQDSDDRPQPSKLPELDIYNNSAEKKEIMVSVGSSNTLGERVFKLRGYNEQNITNREETMHEGSFPVAHAGTHILSASISHSRGAKEEITMSQNGLINRRQISV